MGSLVDADSSRSRTEERGGDRASVLTLIELRIRKSSWSFWGRKCLRRRGSNVVRQLQRLANFGFVVGLAGSLAIPTTLHAKATDGSTLIGDRGATGVNGVGEPSTPEAADHFTGAALHGLRLDLPTGTGGHTPSLTLRYSSSNRKASWVGYGWSLEPSIVQRSLRDGVPTYSETDTFELDGQRLVQGTDPQQPDQFRTRQESFRRIERVGLSWEVRSKDATIRRYGIDENSRVDQATGSTYQWLLAEEEDRFGNIIQYQYEEIDSGRRYLKEIRYTLRRGAGGELVSLSGTVAPDGSVDRVVRFHLETAQRPDRKLWFAAGFPQDLNRRLSHIDVISGGGLMRRYELAYGLSPDSHTSLLKEVRRYGSDADSANPTPPLVRTFKYQSNVTSGRVGFGPVDPDDPSQIASNWSPLPTAYVTEGTAGDYGTRFADLNGDGLIDIIREYSHFNGSYFPNGAWLNSASGFSTASDPDYRLPISANHGDRMSFVHRPQNADRHATGVFLTDLNRDGRADVLKLVSGRRLVPPGSYEYFFDHELHLRTDTGWELVRAGLNPPGTTIEESDEFIASPRFGLVFQVGAPSETNDETHFGDGFTRLVELNGDGRPDLLTQSHEARVDPTSPWLGGQGLELEVWSHEGVSLQHRDGSGYRAAEAGPYVIDCLPGDPYLQCKERKFFNEMRWLHHPIQELGDEWNYLFLGIYSRYGKRYVDVNGDGLDDLVSATTSIRDVFVNEGADYGTSPDNRWSLPSTIELEYKFTTWPPLYQDAGWRFADLNGDGNIDLIRSTDSDGGVWLGTGNVDDPWIEQAFGPEGFPAWFPARLPYDSTNVVFQFVPWDNPSVFYRGMDSGTRLVDLNGDGLVDVIRSDKELDDENDALLNQGLIPDLLRSTTNELGGTTTFTYGPSTRYDNTGDDDLPDLPQVHQVVTSLTVDDGDPETPPQVTALSYAGGRWNAQEREFRGFAEVEATRELDGRTTVTRFHQDDARAGLVESVTVLDAAGNLWSSSETTYTADDVEPYISLPETVIRSEYDGFATPRRSLTEYRYDGQPPSSGGESPITYGNRTATIAYGEIGPTGADVDPSDTRIRELVYASPNDAAYLVDRVSAIRLRTGATPGAGAIVRESLFFYDGDTSGTATPSLGNLTRRVDLLDVASEPDPTTTFTYDVYGNLETVTHPRENAGELGAGLGTWVYTYDPAFSTFVASVTNGLGHRTEFEYDPPAGFCAVENPTGAGLVHVARGPNDFVAGTSIRRCYDAFGRPTLELGPANLTEIAWTYDDELLDGDGVRVVREVRVSTAGDVRTIVEHVDGLGRVFQTDTEGPQFMAVRDLVTFDSAGRIESETEPFEVGTAARTTTFGYDPLDRRIQVTRPGGRVDGVEYDRGRVTFTNPNGLVTVREVDPFGRIRSLIEHGGSDTDKTRYEYDVAGVLTQVTDRGGNVATIGYDTLGRRRTLDDPDLGLIIYDLYDAQGNLRQQTSAAGVVSWTVDPLDRVLTRDDGAFTDVWTYDTAPLGKGRLATRTDASGMYQVEQYDLVGRVLRKRYDVGAKTFSFQASYTPHSQISTRTYPTGRVVAYEYDQNGYPTGIRTQGGSYYVSGIEWEPDERPRRWTLGNGARSEFLYDAATGRTDHIRILSPSQTVLEDLDYTFDPGDRVDLVVVTGEGWDPSASFDFAYDDLNRLTQATGPYAEGFVMATLQYAYDSLGNLTCRAAADRTDCAATGGTVLAYPAPGPSVARPHAPVSVNGQAVTYTPAGNLESLDDRSYEYDAYNQLGAAHSEGEEVAEFRYDAEGRRTLSIDRSNPREHIRHFVAEDFDWDATYELAHIHLRVGEALAATHVEPFTPASAAALGLAPPRAPPWPDTLLLAGIGAAVGASLLVLQLALLRRRGRRLSAPALAGSIFLVFCLTLVAPTLAQIPDGDLNGDGVLDAADALLSLRIAGGELTPTPEQQARGDVAPLELAPDGATDVADALLVLRATRGDDVDGDGLDTAAEMAAGASPFRADTDGDGLSDFAEVTIHGTDPALADTDGDGLSDAEEIDSTFTNPLLADTDGDGLEDGSDPVPLEGVAYQHTDHLGSSVVQLGPDGNLVRRLVYQPFGGAVAPAAGTPAEVPTFGFTGQRFEEGLGLYDYGARWYDPELGRFLQPDPMVPEPDDPQSLNRYSYVRNNPLNRIDPNGSQDALWEARSFIESRIPAPVKRTAEAFLERGAPGAAGQITREVLNAHSGTYAGGGPDIDADTAAKAVEAGAAISDAVSKASSSGDGRAISMDEAVDRGARHVGGEGVIEKTGKKTNYQFRNTTTDEAGNKVSEIARFDVNPNDGHVEKAGGPHLNLETHLTIDGRVTVTKDPDNHTKIDPETVRGGDFPDPPEPAKGQGGNPGGGGTRGGSGASGSSVPGGWIVSGSIEFTD